MFPYLELSVLRPSLTGNFSFPLVCLFLSVLLLLFFSWWFCKFFSSSLSLALVARQNNYVRPILTSESVLDIKNGRSELLCLLNHNVIIYNLMLLWRFSLVSRHVLQEMTVDTFIPNDTRILDEGFFFFFLCLSLPQPASYIININFNIIKQLINPSMQEESISLLGPIILGKAST